MASKFWALYKKELNVFFSMPVAYALITVFLVLSGYFFSQITGYYANFSMRSMNQYQRAMVDLSMVEGVFRPYFSNLLVILILMIPVLTMRMFSEEKREGTAELLFTFPVSDAAVVGAKFMSALTVYAAMLAGTLAGFAVLRSATAFEMLPVLSGFLGLILLGSGFIMLGIFISSLTESQLVAAVISFGVLLLFLVLPWLAQSAGPEAAKIINGLSVTNHFDSFSKGMLDTSDIIYCLNFTLLFFFLTLRVLETKHWRG